MRAVQLVTAAGMFALASAAGAQQSDHAARASWYVRKGSAHETYYASLAAKNAAPPAAIRRDNPAPAPPPAVAGAPGGKVVLAPWHYAGPFSASRSLDDAYGPEKAPVDLTAVYAGAGGKQVGWKAGKFKDGDGHELNRLMGTEAWTAYLYRTMTAAAAMPQKVTFGSDDGIKVWLNGRVVLANNVRRQVNLGDERLVLPMRAGVNHLLVKIVNYGGPGGFAFAMGHVGTPAAGGGSRKGAAAPLAYDEAIVERIRRDFAPDDVRRLMIEFDWLHWDRLGPDSDYRAAAAQAVDLAKRTLAHVSTRKALAAPGAKLKDLEQRLAAAGEKADWRELYFAARRLRREIALADPLLDFPELLIVKRGPPLYSHMCDQYLGRHSQAGDGLVILSDWRDEPKARRMVPAGKLPSGTTHHPDLSYDGKRVVFGFCPDAEQERTKRWFYIWEAAVDGSLVRRLTGVPGRDKLETQDGRHTVYVEDWDPTYLPDGDIVFVSTRNQAFGRCHGGRYTPSYVLYRCDADGNNIRRISWGEANEWKPSILHDGSIMYTRWDYINRHDTIFQSLWTTRPDGTATGHFYGNNSRNPCMISEARAIPGSDRVSALATAHHSYMTGSIIVLDTLKGRDGLEPVTRITPEIPFPEGGEAGPGFPGSFSDPWPLSEEVFLCSYQPDAQAWQGRVQRFNAFGIYLVDAYGGRELLYRDPNVSCFTPIPLRPRPVPPVIASALPAGAAPEGVFFLKNVYQTGRGQIPPGRAKYLRVVGINEQPAAGAAGRSVAANEIVKYVVGEVPFEPDGSVAFRAPADEPLLFQVLDADHMSLFSMRSLVYLQPGEKMSCVGCHEPETATAPLRRPQPQTVHDLADPPWKENREGFNFPQTVQPVLDRYCIGCHGLNTNGPMSLLGSPGRFTVSYDALTGKGLIHLAQRNGETWMSVPGDYGSHASKLAGMLLAGHADKDGKRRVKLDADSFHRIAAWLDLNVQYCGDYSGRNRPERAGFDTQAVKQLTDQLRQAGGELARLADQPVHALLNRAAPGESRVLLAPLAVSAGGWGQITPAFRSVDEPAYKAIHALVMKACGLGENLARAK